LNEFKLAVSILKEEYEKASMYMKKIGKKGEFLNEKSYHLWPLMREFRERDEFLKIYEEIYGYPFIAQSRRNVDILMEIADEKFKNMDELIEQSNSKFKVYVEKKKLAI